ncbi:MAG TPA: carboxypeptidase-like regulatory domain-containing protein [Candidatus Thermoplasmatota archaeon]|nr:carboxypeptidase-like regulatory domain-containing protein [Candidatus Thermoplasmatota archaeon]
MRTLVAFLLVAVTLAGCSSDGGDPDEGEPEVDFDALELEATATTGVIRGIVVDDAIRPLANVTVALRGGGAEASAATTAAGSFGFDGLQPGTYFLTASKPGYFEAQGSADVVAGVEEPPVVKLLLAADVANLPYSVLHKWDGFLECGLSVIALCGVADGVTNDNFATVMVIDGVPLFIQSEVLWDTTTAASDQLWLWHSNGAKPDGEFNGTRNAYAWRQGPSPLVMTSNATEIEESEFGTNNDLFLRMFTGSIEGTRNPADPDGCYPGGAGPDVYCGGVGYSIEQSFTVYTAAFFGYLPPEGWLFHEDGEAKPPA